MKQTSLSRLRKKPTSKLKLVCSFNGAFQVRPPSNKLRYIGSETRIVSVDRNISYSKLHSEISDICPNVRSFTLKYQLPVSGRSRNDPDSNEDMPLVLIASDEDVKCMVEEYDKLELYGKHARLWVFACSKIECDDNGTNGLFKGNSEDSLRKMVLKQQLLANQSKREIEFAFCGENQSYEHPLIDLGLGTQTKFLTSQNDSCGENMLVFNGMGNARLHPLNPRDGNLRVETNGPLKWTMGRSVSGLHNWGGTTTVNTGQSSLPLKEEYNCGMVSMCNGLYGKTDFKKTGQMSASNFNRENIMPWAVNYDPLKTHLESLSCSNQGSGSLYPVKSSCVGDRVWSACQNGTSNHRFGLNNTRNHRIFPYPVRSHRKNLVEVGNHGDVRYYGKIPAGKCHLSIRQDSNISKQGQSMGINNPNLLKLWPGFAEHALEGRVNAMASCLNKGSSSFDVQYSKKTFREQGGPAILRYGNSNLQENHLAYHGTCDCVDNLSFLSHNAIKTPSSFVKLMNTQEDILTGSNFEKLEVPYLTPYENFHGMPTNHEPVCCDIENHKFLADSLEDANISGFSNNMDYRNGTALECKMKNDTKSLQGGIASSMDLLYNLSLSSPKETEHPQNSSLRSSVVSDALLKPQLKPLGHMDEGHFSACPTVDPNRTTSCSSSQNAAKSGTADVHGEEIQKDPPPALRLEEKVDTKKSHKCSKVFSGISSDLKAFFTHLASEELQTIKNSDLEYIKELGSGTFGTVFYGKWKGSDVAIKRMKPSCFTEDSLEEDRLVADFWKEAHMLSQLHHPNIVAFYGVVTDGPATNLATVTEYMVNGSLKQVLQRKDRTIDRRKRLIIAMDAAFGMEYLHEKNTVHFDLKSHNFLVNMRDPQRPICKIGDLGLSKIKQKTLISGGVRGTIPWMAPELLNNKNNLVTEKIDVYSFGIVMWELLTGEEPSANLHSEEIIAGIIKGTLRPEIPSWCDPTWRSLMGRCWSSDPDSRPAFSEISKELRAMATAMNVK